jgi:hypothetical protein
MSTFLTESGLAGDKSRALDPRMMNANANDLFREIPPFDELLRHPAVQGALTSLVGEGCR